MVLAARHSGLSMRLEKKHYLRLLQAGVSLAIVYYLLQLVDWQTVGRLFVSGDLLSLWPGPLILLLGMGLAAERWRAVLVFLGLNLRRNVAFKLYLIGNFYSVLLPGVLGGDVVRAAMCRAKTGGTTAAVLTSVAIERALGLWGVTLIGSVGVLGVVLFMPYHFEVVTLLLNPLMAVALPLFVYIAHIVTRLAGRSGLRQKLIARVVEALAQFSRRVRELPSGLALRTILFSTAFQASEIFIYFYFSHVMRIEVPFLYFLFAIPLVYLATVLPISLGGIGVREGVLVWFLSIIGIHASDAAMLAFLVYLNRVLIGVFGGFVNAIYKN